MTNSNSKKKISWSFFVFAIWLFSCSTSHLNSQSHTDDTNYSYSPPKNLDDGISVDKLNKVNIDSNKIIELAKLILKDTFPNIHSLLILKDNKLVYEKYFSGSDEISGKKIGVIQHSIDVLHDCRSISKSVTSASIGIAIKQGLLKSIDEPIFQYFKSYEKYFDEEKKKITIRNLLTMTSGLKWNEDISYRDFRNSELQMDMSSNPIQYILSRPMVSKPGVTWNYNGGGTQLLAQIIETVSGLSLDKFAEKNLFIPLGIKKYEWRTLIKNMPAAASGLRLRSRDFLKFGMLYMNNGKYGKTSILNEEWALESLSPLVQRTTGKMKNSGYGYQFWTYSEIVNNNIMDIVEARGNGGQRIFFCKSINLLVVITAGNYNKWDIANDSHSALVNYIIPAIH